ncbi:FlxA-like family protein [Thermosulfuriphilus sp.]
MNRLKTLFLVLLALLMVSIPARAESPEELKAQIEVLKRQMAEMQAQMQAQIEALQKKLEQVQSQGVAPQVVAKEARPVFSKKNTEWLLYGKIKTDFNYDTAQMIYYKDFIGAVANRAQHPDVSNDSTNFNPRDTRFGFWAAHKEGNWLVKGRFEMDFYGYNNGNNLIPRMRLAYTDITNLATKTSLRIGQDWIPIARLNPSTVDFGILTAAGNLWWRVPQATVRQKLNDNWEVLVALMKHRRIDPAREDRMPWLLTRVAYSGGILGPGNMIALGAGYRHASYETQDSDNVDRWLAVAEWKFYLLGKQFLFKGEAWVGEGIGENFLRYELDTTQNGDPVSASGGWADLTWFFAPRWSATVGFGFDNPSDSDIMEGRTVANLSDRQFTQNTQYFANIWYQLTKPVKVGFEVIHIETERDKQTDVANRFTLSVQYLF